MVRYIYILGNGSNSENVNEKFRNSFSIMGIPETINTDNGPPFNSEHFQRFCKSNGINLKYSPP